MYFLVVVNVCDLMVVFCINCYGNKPNYANKGVGQARNHWLQFECLFIVIRLPMFYYMILLIGSGDPSTYFKNQ